MPVQTTEEAQENSRTCLSDAVYAGDCVKMKATDAGRLRTPSQPGRGKAMAAWTIGVEIRGARIDAEGLVRLDEVFKRKLPEFEADCAIWSGWLAVHGIVRAPTPTEAVDSALTTIGSAFDDAGIDMSRESEIINVTMRRVLRARSASDSDADSLSRALLRLVSPSQRQSRST